MMASTRLDQKRSTHHLLIRQIGSDYSLVEIDLDVQSQKPACNISSGATKTARQGDATIGINGTLGANKCSG